MCQEGKIPKLDKILDDSDEEVLPDKEIQVCTLLSMTIPPLIALKGLPLF